MAAPMGMLSISLRLSGKEIKCKALHITRKMSTRRGLVLGIYEGAASGEVKPTRSTQTYLEKKAPQLTKLIQISGLAEKKGNCRVFYGLDDDHAGVAIIRMGKQDVGYNSQEQWQEDKENVRAAVAAGVKQLEDHGMSDVDVDPCGDAQAAAEAATLILHHYDELKTGDNKKPRVNASCFSKYTDNSDNVISEWERGVLYGEGQNLARMLMEAPANSMTPTRFASIAQEKLGSLENTEVIVRDRAWAEEKGMGAFIGVSHGSDEPLRFVEVHYRGGPQDQPPLAIVGKGITFDSGGISIKPSAKMDEMRADMGGAACTLSSIYTAARLKLPINVIGFMPLCENMPGARATKPGDVHTTMSGKTVQVDNTDAEGRLILADALHYAQTFSPRALLDMATLTGAVGVALGAAASGAFTNSDMMWENMSSAGQETGDRVWRLPVFKLHTKEMTEAPLADMNNLGTSRSAGASTAAAFLKEFVTVDHWMHLDIAGVMTNTSQVPYLGKGMSGRPTRTVVEFIKRMSQQK